MKRQREDPKLDINLSLKCAGLNIPTMDPHCMAVLTYFKFIGVKPGRIDNRPSTKQPYFAYEDISNDKQTKTIEGTRKIIDYVRSQQPPSKYDLDVGLKAKQRSKHIATTSYILDIMMPCVLYIMWCDGKNYQQTTKPSYKEGLPILRGWYEPYAMHLRVRKQIFDMFGTEVTKEDIYKSLLNGLLMLDALVSVDKNFMILNTPTSLDAYAYGVLSCLAYPNYKDQSINSILSKFPKLVAYCQMITKTYFEPDAIKQDNQFKEAKTLNDIKLQLALERDQKTKSYVFLAASVAALSLPMLLRVFLK
ncbi:metaxin [Acrasis kona]|uniref:Metaxin n=1 Tax=Acrasis kona TaxID=1008807 RepID=A0AAW2Z1E0_9EUKA